MKNFKYNELKAALAICVVCAIAIIAEGVGTLIFPKFLPPATAAVLGVFTGVLLLASLAMLYFRIRRELRFFASLMMNFDDIGFIKYDKRKHKAVAHGKIEEITGVKTCNIITKKEDYDKLLDELYRNEHDFEDGIFSSQDGRSWYRLISYESENLECTTIRDVTEYIEKTGIINNLRYYDSLTGLLNKQAITDILKRKVEHAYKSLGIVHFAIIGMDKIVSFKGSELADETMVRLAASAKSFDNSKSIYAGRMGSIGITILLTQDDHEFDDYYEKVKEIHDAITGTIESLSEDARRYVRIYCGYVIYRGRETNAVKMLSAAEFAAFYAHKRNDGEPVRYDSASFKESEGEFKKVKIFSEIVSENRIDYHFQPIVNARTGDVYGYEALMRPHEIDEIRLTPQEMLTIADEQNALERIESITLFETLKILSENQDVFHDKRLFVNSVSCATLTESEYCELIEAYSELLPKLTIEITEVNRISENTIPMLNKFFKPYRAHVALDDYGAGYSNDKTLLDVMPNYIKIDRSLISDINRDAKKKQLVANIISYASDHGVYSLAEGVETEQELETVIFLGVDLIQGYYTCRPVPMFMHEISADIKSTIVKYSIKHAKRDDKVYEVKDSNPVDLVNLAVFGYTDIVIRHNTVNFFGDTANALNMRIICPEDFSVLMKIKDVNIHCDEMPVVEIGDNSMLTLVAEGNNTMSNQGIRVPETARFMLQGDGNLNINGAYVDSVCLGGNSTQKFGRIDLESTGQLTITNKCDKCVCIGGGIGGPEAFININSGEINLNSRGMDAVGMGTHEGDVLIILNDCSLSVDVSGINVVAIGSANGNADIRSSADIAAVAAGSRCCLIGTQNGENVTVKLHKGDIKLEASGMSIAAIGGENAIPEIDSNADIQITASGDNCCLVGSHKCAKGKVNLNNGYVSINCNAKHIIGIGTFDGNCDILLSSGTFDLQCEGNDTLCIGSLKGGGDITLGGIVLNAIANSANRQSVATKNGKITITGGNIYTNSIDPLDAYGPHGSKLICSNIPASEEPGGQLERTVTDNGQTYRYSAKQTPLFDGYYIFLPENR